MFIIRRLKKLPIFDLFLSNLVGWSGWSRVSFNSTQVLQHLDGRRLTSKEKEQAKKEITNVSKRL